MSENQKHRTSKSPTQPVPVESESSAVVQHKTPSGNVVGGITRYTARVVKYTAGVVLSMPTLEEPKFEEEYLPENSNIIKSIVYTWYYNYKKFEYSIDPLRRGFHAWIRLALSIAFFIALPVVVIIGTLYGVIYWLLQTAGITLDVIKATLLILLGILGAILLGYLIYWVVALIFGLPIKLPTLNIVQPKAKK